MISTLGLRTPSSFRRQCSSPPPAIGSEHFFASRNAPQRNDEGPPGLPGLHPGQLKRGCILPQTHTPEPPEGVDRRACGIPPVKPKQVSPSPALPVLYFECHVRFAAAPQRRGSGPDKA